MTTPHFFGYGSLVHRGTHTYPVRTPATLSGWRRVWRQSATRNVAFLSVTRAPGDQISGLIAGVPDADWAALDARERAYDRIRLAPQDVDLTETEPLDLHLYEANPAHVAAPGTRHPILLSYLDTVIGGYVSEFGRSGADRFFATTDGWNTPVLDDRASPIYPRAQALPGPDRDLVDGALRALSAQVQQLQKTCLPREGRARGIAGLQHHAPRQPDR